MGMIAEGRYTANPTAAALSDGQPSDIQVDVAGNPKSAAAIARVTAIPSTVFNSATTTSGNDLTFCQGRGIILYLDITSFTAAGTSTTVNVQAKFGSDYLTVYTFAPTIAATGLQAFVFYPGAASAGSWTAAPVQGVIPSVFRVQVVTVGAVNYTATYGIDFVS